MGQNLFHSLPAIILGLQDTMTNLAMDLFPWGETSTFQTQLLTDARSERRLMRILQLKTDHRLTGMWVGLPGRFRAVLGHAKRLELRLPAFEAELLDWSNFIFTSAP